MATKTKNYNLIKPDLTDDADIRVINGNMDVLDNQLKSISDTANDVNNKLPLTGGTMTGSIKTADNIYKNTNNGVLTLSGSTDALHGGRIDLSGEKQTNAGAVKITADNGTVSNVFEVSTSDAGSRYNFNGLTTYMNSSDDYFRFGDNDAYLRLGKDKQLYCNTERINLSKTSITANDGDLFKVGEGTKAWFAVNQYVNKLFYSPQGTNTGYEIPYATTPLSFRGTQTRGAAHEGYIKFNNGLLIQWGSANHSGTQTWNYPVNLPLPYANTGYVAMSTLTFPNDSHYVGGDNRDLVYVQSESAIGVWSDNGSIVFWMTIGQGA